MDYNDIIIYISIQQTPQQWQYVFLITAAMLIACGLIYLLFTVAELQPWNSPMASNNAAEIVESFGSEQKSFLADSPINQ